MNASTNTESNPQIHSDEPLQTVSYYDRNNYSIGQDIDVTSHITYYSRSFEGASSDELSYHFDQEYTSTDI